MNSKLRSTILAAIAAAAVICAAQTPAGQEYPPKSDPASSTDSPELNSGRDALRHIVQELCVVHWREKRSPAPCERVFLADATRDDSGYAVLADRKGGAHYLLIPTRTMAGVDSSELLDPDTPNYFAEAWHARDMITKFVGHDVPRGAVGLAINTAHSRSQDQFHVHIECVRQDVYASLHAAAERISDVWAPVTVAGSTYLAQRINGEDLDGSNPFEMLATLKPDARQHMGNYTLVVAGMQFRSGPGFVVLAGTGPTGELLLDATCAVAGAGG